MATSKTPEEVKSAVFESLKGSQFAATSLERLSGGAANFVYRANLFKPLEDGTTDVLVKHGEGYMATYPSNKLSTIRCRIEFECLVSLASFRIQADEADGVRFLVRTPKCYTYNQTTNTQIQEYLPHGINLKAYALEHFSSPTPVSLRPQCFQLGKALARWIADFHEKRYGTESKLKEELKSNKEMQELKRMINYDWLLQRINQFPSILEKARDILEQVKEMAEAEMNESSQVTFIHGDFCPGNILLPNASIRKGVQTPIFIVDWENAQLGEPSLDGGEMIGELYALWLYRKIDAGLWMVQGYAEGLGQRTEAAAWRLVVQIGVHLLAFGAITPGWGTAAQVDDVVRIGRDIIVNAWQRNRGWFENGDLACCFSQITL